MSKPAVAQSCSVCHVALSFSQIMILKDQVFCPSCFSHARRNRYQQGVVAERFLTEDPAELPGDRAAKHLAVQAFLGDLPYSVLRDELAKHDLFIDDKYDKVGYRSRTGQEVPETDVLGCCHCDPDCPTFFIGRGEGTMTGWHAARSKVKAEFDKHIAMRLVPEMRAYATRQAQYREAGVNYVAAAATQRPMFSWQASTI